LIISKVCHLTPSVGFISKIYSIAKTIENTNTTIIKFFYGNIAKKIPTVNMDNNNYLDIPF
jgi:hypothetical protein